MKPTLLRRLSTCALLCAMAAPTLAAGVSHVMSYSRAFAPSQSNEQILENVPYWNRPFINGLSTHAKASGIDTWGSVANAEANVQARADYSWVGVQAKSTAEGLNYFGQPWAAAGSGQAGAILQLDWVITGASGVFGTIQVSGAMRGHVFGDTSIPGGSGAAGLMATLGKDGCYYGPTCLSSFSIDLKRSSDDPTHATTPYADRSYTLSLEVKPGDHIYLQYLAHAETYGNFSAGAGTSVDLSMPGTARAGEGAGADLQAPSFAQIIQLSSGLGLSDTEGLTQLADGSYGFGEVSAVPEPAAWALMLAGLPLLGRRLRGRAAGRVA